MMKKEKEELIVLREKDHLKNYTILLYKVRCFIGILDTDKTDNLTCENIYDNFTRENYRFSHSHHSLLMDILYCLKRL